MAYFLTFVFVAYALLIGYLIARGHRERLTERSDARACIDWDRPEDPALETRRLKQWINEEHERNFGRRCPHCGREYDI